MDKSVAYIQMAQAAEKVQQLRIPLHLFFEGDWFARKNRQGQWYCTLATTNGKGRGRSIYFKAVDAVWLPDQEALRNLLGCPLPTEWLYETTRYVQRAEHYYRQFATMEQLLLAVLMREQYGKVWDGTQWTSWTSVAK